VIEIDSEGVLQLLRDIDTSKTCGPDNISGQMLKTFSSVIYESLTEIFSYSLATSTLPKIWKTARVQPIHKNGSKQSPNNYRPISLTCITCKIFEHIISSHMHKIFSNCDFLTDSQHGFRSHRSCETQLAHTVGHITHLFDLSKTIDIIILDFSKAFDSVNHRMLIFKLRCIGLNELIVGWIESFLKDRTQFVEVDGCKSELRAVASGVPQGSAMGPLLFLVFINDLPAKIKSHCRLFADDALIYNTSDKANVLIEDLKTLETWSEQWQMSFNIAKCAHLRVGKGRDDDTKYSFCGKQLDTVTSHPYLGIELQSNLKWDRHIGKIVTKATQLLAMLRRVLKTADLPTRKIAYLTIVRPTLEYAGQIWDPYTKTQIKQLEKVQNQAMRFIFRIKGRTSFKKLREDTGFPSLQERRKISRVKLYLRCLSEGIEPSFEYDLEKGHNTRQQENTYTPFIRTNVFYHSFWPRTLREMRS